MKNKFWPLVGLAFAAALAAVLAAVPPSGVCVTPSGVYVQGWWSAWARWLFWPVEAVLLAGGMFLSGFAKRRFSGSRLAALPPLAFLPALVMLPHGLAPIDHTLAGIVLPLGGTFLAAICAERALRPFLDAPASPGKRPAKVAWMWFAASLLLLLAFYFGVAKRQRFNGGGDVKHYVLQAENLHERGSLDLTERAEAMMAAAGVADKPAARAQWLRLSHMRANADGRIYSYHTFGFPLLLWLFREVFGPWGRGMLLALIGALSLCGVRSACLAHGAPRTAADTVSLLTGLSFVWVYTAMSCLPEMLGFGLVAWAFWAVAAQNRHGWRWPATAVAALACVYLPLAHVRFTPMAGLLAAAFGIEGLCLRGEPFWRRKAPRLAVFSLICFGAWGAFWLAQKSMFSGTSAYNYSRIAGRVPLVMWAMFSDRRGVVSLVPGISAFLAAAVVALFRRDAAARRAAMALAVAAATLWFCCCTPVALGGACLNGRYFYPVLPLLLPFFAIALARATRPGRLWLLFLALLPAFYFLFLSWFLTGAPLIRAPVPARGFLGLSLLWEPFPAFFGEEATPAGTRVVGSLFAAALFGLSALACTRRGPAPLRAIAAVALLGTAFFCGRFVDRVAPPKRIAPFDALMDDRHFNDFRVLGPRPADYFSAFLDPDADSRLVYVLTDDPERPHDGVYRLQHPSELAVDDWRGRPLRWGKAHSSFILFTKERGTIAAPGTVAARATGRVVRGTAHLALQVGGVPDAPDVPLDEGPFDVVFVAHVARGNEGGNFRLALENDSGEAYIATTQYAPCPPALLPLLGGFPPSPPLRIVPFDIPTSPSKS
jgi:hypothetical protein